MALDYSTPNLLAMVRDLIYAGSSQRDWDDTRLVRLMNREIAEYLVPLMTRARENHFVTFVDLPLVALQKFYRIPSKATGLKVRAVQLVDGSGNAYQPMKEQPLDDAINLSESIFGTMPQQGMPTVYFFVGNQLALYPVPTTGLPATSLRIWYVARPSTLVPVTDPATKNPNALQITGFPGGAAPGNFRLSYTASAQPSWLAVNATLDLAQNTPGFDVLGSFVVAAATASTVDLTGTLPSARAVGDWICQSDQAPVITGAIPEIVIGCLIKKCALEATAAKGDQEAFGRLAGLLKLDEDKAVQFLNRRSTGDHRKAGQLAAFRFKRGATPF